MPGSGGRWGVGRSNIGPGPAPGVPLDPAVDPRSPPTCGTRPALRPCIQPHRPPPLGRRRRGEGPGAGAARARRQAGPRRTPPRPPGRPGRAGIDPVRRGPTFPLACLEEVEQVRLLRAAMAGSESPAGGRGGVLRAGGGASSPPVPPAPAPSPSPGGQGRSCFHCHPGGGTRAREGRGPGAGGVGAPQPQWGRVADQPGSWEAPPTGQRDGSGRQRGGGVLLWTEALTPRRERQGEEQQRRPPAQPPARWWPRARAPRPPWRRRAPHARG